MFPPRVGRLKATGTWRAGSARQVGRAVVSAGQTGEQLCVMQLGRKERLPFMLVMSDPQEEPTGPPRRGQSLLQSVSGQEAKALVRVLITDAHRMFGEALKLVLAPEAGIEVVGVGSADEALDMCRERNPDVVVMDLDSPNKGGIETCRRLREMHPGVRILVIMATQQPEIIAQALGAGASGYIAKTHALKELVSVVRQVANGGIALPVNQMAPLVTVFEEARRARSVGNLATKLLTSREIEILQALAEGNSTDGVARQLFISRVTVQSHVKSILSKLGVHSRLEAVAFGLRTRIITISQYGS